jgi:hypothetical protein
VFVNPHLGVFLTDACQIRAATAVEVTRLRVPLRSVHLVARVARIAVIERRRHSEVEPSGLRPHRSAVATVRQGAHVD